MPNDNPSPEALVIWTDKLTVPEGKGLRLFVRNQADRDMTDLRIYWDPAQTKYFVPDQTTIPARTIIEVGLPPEKVKANSRWTTRYTSRRTRMILF